ncbi:MAG: UbiA family prenyltransferase [Hyphomicrobiaceae bacterium]
MSGAAQQAVIPLWQRLWIYQAERFPVFKTAILLAAFGSASINVSAFLGGRDLPGITTYLLAFLVLFIFFFHLRACDEVKDAEDDRRYRPERPIPRGLVSQRLIVGIAFALAPVAVAASVMLAPAMILPLAAVWIWLALMTAEFGVPKWLKARPMLYLVSHMAIMPLIDLFVTGAEWLPHAQQPPAGLWLFLALSFVNGCVLEFGRKLYAPDNERPGVETYTALMGLRGATLAWIAWMTVALALLAAVGFAIDTPLPIIAAGVIAYAYVVAVAILFLKQPTTKTQAHVDTAAGLWVFACYMAAGYLPLLHLGGAQ